MRVIWERVDGGPAPYMDVRDNNLIINQIDMAASGLYQCNGINDRGQKIPMIRAALQVLPVITIYPKVPQYMTIGQTLELTCNATGADRSNWFAEHYLR